MYEFGRFSFDPQDHLLLSEGEPVAITPKAFEILLVLVENGGRLTTKEELMRRVWPDSFVEEANLTVNISALRRLLGETADGRPYIDTVPKKGYRFVAAISEVSKSILNKGTPAQEQTQQLDFQSAKPLDPTPMPSPSHPQGPGRHKSWIPASFSGPALLLVMLAGGVYFIYHARPARKPSAGQPHRLAVLPFQNLRTNAETDFLGFSLADAVITKLGYISELTVRPSYAVQKYKTQAMDTRRIASELNVDTLLTGTFLREGEDLRITCQLVDIKTQNILWKGGFDLKYEKLLTVQDRVATQIINGLELTLSPSEVARLQQDKTVTPLAYEYYLRGIDLYSTSDFPMAIKMLEKSTEVAPNYALTWANLGKSYAANASLQFGGGAQYQKAQKAFERALALQSDQIEARIYMANMFTDTGRVERAVPLLREALKANPNHAEIHWELGYAYRFGGMLSESVSESEQARHLDPGVKLNSSALNGYLYLGQYNRFLESLPKTDDSALIVFYRGFGHYHQGETEEATKHFDHALKLDPSLFQAQIGGALTLGIRHHATGGLAILRQVEEKIDVLGVGDPEATYKIAEAYAVLGDKSSALRVLRRSIENGFFSYPYFLTDPLLDNIRKEPEFSQLMNTARQRHESFANAFFS